MKLFSLFSSQVFFFTFTILASQTPPEPLPEGENKWVCEGYCFLGGDVPTDPFQPVSATGATEQEARDNIDCGPYTETGIVCREVQN